jgi:superoxide dismutase, Cu-Zn family
MYGKTVIAAAAAAIVATGILSTTASAAAEPTGHHAHPAHAYGAFTPYGPKVRAVTHDPKLVPVGAHVFASSLPRHGRTTVVLAVHGLIPNREYGAHAHQKTCGPAPADSGSHYQNVVDPVQPSVDPAYANPENEVWLDFTTDEDGDAYAVSEVDWQWTDRHARSIVIHAEHTMTDPGHAGMAGARLACLNIGL